MTFNTAVSYKVSQTEEGEKNNRDKNNGPCKGLLFLVIELNNVSEYEVYK